MNSTEIMLNIKHDKENGRRPIPCVFYITVPKLLEHNIKDDENIKKIIEILNKYDIKWERVDTVEGSYNLNRDWIETSDINCYIEYGGCYPIEWDINDIVKLQDLEYEGEIIIRVLWHNEDGTYVPNH